MLNCRSNDQFAVRLNASSTNDAGFINQPDLYRLDASGAPVAPQPGLVQPARNLFQEWHQLLRGIGRRASRHCGCHRMCCACSCPITTSARLRSGFPYSSPQFGVDSLTSTDHLRASTADEVNLAVLVVEANLGFCRP